ncbi:MAG TPA: hypothetical protein VLL52_00385, partial [Anaerolineae bacterium]|nr:hypothetical protein [Anaerolineae bacterium]
MPIFTLDVNALSSLIQSILAALFAVYLLQLRSNRRANRFLGGMAAALTVSFVTRSWSWSWVYSPIELYTTFIADIAIFVSAYSGIAFAYYFPHPLPHETKERRLILTTMLLVPTAAILQSIYHAYTIHTSQFDQWALYPSLINILNVCQILQFIWAVIILVRHTIYHSAQENPSLSWWTHLIKPQNQPARAARAFIFAFSIPIILEPIFVLMRLGLLPGSSQILGAFIFSTLLFTTCIIYLNHAPEETTFMIKLVAISLFTFLVVMSLVGFIVAPFYTQSYQYAPFPPSAAYTFTPTSPTTYQQQPTTLIPASLPTTPRTNQPVQLPFTFPFYNQQWSQLYINNNGTV